MEVHAHTHTARKKWTHYFWEFLMLFLAVFCGFLAEYQLEHKIEKDREKQYIRSLADDLRSDISMLQQNISLRQSRLMMIDSLVLLLHSSDRDKTGNDIYYYARSISPPANIFPNDGTIQQLKSSGNLRLIRDEIIARDIMTYDQRMRNVLFEMGDEVEIRAEYRLIARKIFRTPVFHDMIADVQISRPLTNPGLFSNDPALINEFIGEVQYFKRVHQAQLIRSEQLLAQANQLITEIQAHYHIK